MSKILNTATDANGVISIDGEPKDSSVVDMLTLPLSSFSPSSEFVNKQFAGQAILAASAVTAVLVNAYSHKQANAGDGPWLNVFGA